jgi:hypothetical protein
VAIREESLCNSRESPSVETLHAELSVHNVVGPSFPKPVLWLALKLNIISFGAQSPRSQAVLLTCMSSIVIG